MVVQQKEMLVGADLQKTCSQLHGRFEVEGRGALLPEPLVRHCSCVTTLEPFRSELHRERRVDDLLHDVLMEAERRAQGGVSVDQGSHCPLQSRPIEGSAQSPQCRHVIGGEPRLQLVQEPEAGLPKRGGIDLAARWPGAWQGGRDGDVQRGRGGETFPQPGDATR